MILIIQYINFFFLLPCKKKNFFFKLLTMLRIICNQGNIFVITQYLLYSDKHTNMRDEWSELFGTILFKNYYQIFKSTKKLQVREQIS